ncbi:hypothetical protein ABTN42_21755, partial [Acinetobacter baumannii]
MENYIPSSNVQALLNADSRYIKDLKINATNVLNNTQYLTKKEAILLALAVAVNERFDLLKASFNEMAAEAGVTDMEIAEVI